jgi:DNA recombination protein RmuC
MREQAGFIQTEVTNLLRDIERMDKRIGNLARHFGNVQDDIKEIQTSSKKVSTRGNRIEEMQFSEETSSNPSEPNIGTPQLVPLTDREGKGKLPSPQA